MKSLMKNLRWQRFSLFFLPLFLLTSILSFGSERIEQPTIAIVNRGLDAKYTFMLLSELSKFKDIRMIEREDIEVVLKEQFRSSIDGENSIAIGKVIGADAIVYMYAGGQSSLILQVVETARGETIFYTFSDIRQSNAPQTYIGLAECLHKIFLKLAIPEKERIYISIPPGIKSVPMKSDLVELFFNIVTNIIIEEKKTFILNRSFLPDIVDENLLKRISAAPSNADLIIRSEIEQSKSGKNAFDITVLLQSIPHKTKKSFVLHLDEQNIRKTAEECVAQIFSTINIVHEKSSQNLAVEAEMYRLLSLSYTSEKELLKAVKCLEIACLLSPDNQALKQDFVNAVFNLATETANNSLFWDRTGNVYISEHSCMEVVRHLEQAIGIIGENLAYMKEQGKSTINFEHGLLDPRKYLILAINTENYSLESRMAIAECKKRICELFKWYCFSVTTNKRDDFCVLAPILYDSPKDLCDFYKHLISDGNFKFELLQENFYTRIFYQDEETAEKEWMKFLDELSAGNSIEAQFYARFAKCEYYGAFEQFACLYKIKNKAKAIESSYELFRWLALDDKNSEWVIRNVSSHRFSFFYPLGILKEEEQNRFFKGILMKLIWRSMDEQRNVFSYLRWRYKENDKRNAQEILDLGEFYIAAVKSKAPNKTYNNAINSILEDNKWYSELANIQIAEQKIPLGIDKNFIIFDSDDLIKDEKIKSRSSFDNFRACVDKSILWLVWKLWEHEGSGFGIIRMNMDTGEKDFYKYISEAKDTPLSSSRSFITTRDKHLILVGGELAVVIEIADQKPYLKIKRAKELRSISGGKNYNGKNLRYSISSIIPAKDCIFLGMKECDKRGGIFGGIAMWNISEEKAEIIVASNFLKEGGLNDCAPYTVFAGCPNPSDNSVFFFITDQYEHFLSPEARKSGIWKLDRISEHFTLIQKINFYSSSDIISPCFYNPNSFNFATYYDKNYIFNLESGEIACIDATLTDPLQKKSWSFEHSTSGPELNEILSDKVSNTYFRSVKKKNVFRVESKHVYVRQFLPYNNFLIVLISYAGESPSNRGMAYKIPQ